MHIKGGIMDRKMLKLLIICFLLCPLILSAAKVGVLRFKGVGVDKETADAVAELLTSDLAGYGHQVLNPAAIDAAAGEVVECYEAGCAAEVGFKAQVERVIFGSVSKLGEKHIIQASVVNVSTREVIWSGSLAAKTVDDLDTVIKRIAKAIAEGKKVEEGAEIGMITDQEIKTESKRKEGFYLIGGGFNYALPLSGYAGAGSLMGLTLYNWFETKLLTIQLNWSVLWSLNADPYDTTGNASVMDMGMGDLSVDYMFNKGDISPYIGGGVGLHMVNFVSGTYNPAANMGLNLMAGGGVALLRTYDFHLFIDARYSINLANIAGYGNPHQSIKFSIGIVNRPKGGGCGGGGCGGGGLRGGCM